MLNRKESKLATRARDKKQAFTSKAPATRRRRFVLSPRAHARAEAHSEQTRKNGGTHEKNGAAASDAASIAKAAYASSHPTPAGGALSQPLDLTTVIKNLV